ncbi:MAG: flagellar FlbD family protein [Bacillota bacterium]
MIRLTTLDNREITVNAELIERVESVPETVLTMVNNKKILVIENVDQVVARVIRYRRMAYPFRLYGKPHREVR